MPSNGACVNRVQSTAWNCSRAAEVDSGHTLIILSPVLIFVALCMRHRASRKGSRFAFSTPFTNTNPRRENTTYFHSRPIKIAIDSPLGECKSPALSVSVLAEVALKS